MPSRIFTPSPTYLPTPTPQNLHATSHAVKPNPSSGVSSSIDELTHEMHAPILHGSVSTGTDSITATVADPSVDVIDPLLQQSEWQHHMRTGLRDNI